MLLRWLTLVLAFCVVSGTSRGEPRNVATETLWGALLAGNDGAAALPDDALMFAMQPASLAADPGLVLRSVLARSTPAQIRYRGEGGRTPAHRALASEATFIVLEASIAAGQSPDTVADGG
ncbi:MAG: hypothetical protein ACREUE_00815 [Panacagrimonas sp.]